MKNNNKKSNIIQILFIVSLIASVYSLSGSQISLKCHCDITTSFCDFGCCCDIDCGSSISDSCFYAKSSFYCPKTQFFKSIKPSSTGSNMCYYYNTSTILINEQTLTNTQRTQQISQNQQILPSSITLNSGYKGYKSSTDLLIGGKSSFSFTDQNGNCLNSTSSSTTFKLRFGQNTKISCKCNNYGTPLLFSDILGKSIASYFEVNSDILQTPFINDSTMTSLRINFIIGKYGSQKVKFINKITYSYESTASTIRTLYINFIDSDNIKQQDKSASFFPQIPLDMFYPIHVMS